MLCFILSAKCKLNPVCCSRLSLLALRASRARRQSFPRNVYNATGSSHLQKDSYWKCLPSYSRWEHLCSFPWTAAAWSKPCSCLSPALHRGCAAGACNGDQSGKALPWHGFLWRAWKRTIKGSAISHWTLVTLILGVCNGVSFCGLTRPSKHICKLVT